MHMEAGENEQCFEDESCLSDSGFEDLEELACKYILNSGWVYKSKD